MNSIIKTIAITAIRIRINATAIISPKKAAILCWEIFGKPRKGKLRPRDTEFLNGATWHKIPHAEGVEIQCYEWKGAGIKVLLAHGWESNSARWMKLINFLRKHDAHIICMDAPAHGASGGRLFDAAKYAKFMNTVVQHFEPQHIVGHSVGGFAITIFLSSYPNQVEKAVILGVPSDLAEILTHFSNFIGLSKRAKNAMFEEAIPRFGLSVDVVSVKNNYAKKLTTKGLVIHDENDLVAPFTDGKAIHQSWKNSDFFATKGLGHGLLGKEVYEKIRDFLEKERRE